MLSRRLWYEEHLCPRGHLTRGRARRLKVKPNGKNRYKGKSRQHSPQAGGDEGSGFFLSRSIHCPVCCLPPGTPTPTPEICSHCKLPTGSIFTGLSSLSWGCLGFLRSLCRLLRTCHRLGEREKGGGALLSVVLNQGNPEVFTCKVVCALPSPGEHSNTPIQHLPKPEILLWAQW